MRDEPRIPVLLIDGHSIIFAWEDLRALHRQKQLMAREELCRRLRQFQDSSGEQVVIVFDGKGTKTTSERASQDDIQIIYSGKGKTADDVIERLVAHYAVKYDLTVATADRAEIDTVMAFGGYCISPRTLLEKLEAAEARLSANLARLRKE